MRDPRYNKGLAFTDKERDSHYLTGLLPPVVLSQDVQVNFEFFHDYDFELKKISIFYFNCVVYRRGK